MEKTRVPKGEKYWYIVNIHFDNVDWHFETNDGVDNRNFEMGNYFHTKEEAESMAHKLRAVLAGADVIQMPSEEEIEDAMKTSITESILSVSPYEQFTPRATDLLECAWMRGAEWLKLKIIK